MVEIAIDELLATFLAPEDNAGEFDYTEDVLTRIEFPGLLEDSYFLYSSNQVFARIKPGLLSVLSGSLLNPKLDSFSGRLYPGFCPGPSDTLPTFLKGQISDLLKRHIEMQLGSVLVEVSEKPLLSKHGVDRHMNTFSKTAVMIGDAIGISYDTVDIGRSQAVVLVIGLSLIIATFIGVGLAFAVVTAARDAVKRFVSFRDLCDAVFALHGAVTRPQEAQEANDDDGNQGGGNGGGGGDATALVSKTKQRLQRLEKLVDEQSQTSSTVNTVYNTLGLGRSYYQLADFVVKTVKTSGKDSLAEFTKDFMVENASALQVDGVRHLDFCREYEVYCTKHRLTIESIKSNGEKLKALGLYKESVSGAMTEVFIRLRFKSASSIESLPENPNPGDSSLDLFIDSEVELTPFDTDCINVSDFRKRYELFIDKHSDLVEVPITPRMMQKYSSALVRKKVTYYLAIPTHGSGMKGAEVTSKSSQVFKAIASVFGTIFVYGPHINILLTTVVHMLSTLVVPFPMLLLAVFSQLESAKYKLPQENIFGPEELFIGPLPRTFNYEAKEREGLEWQNAAIIVGVTVYYVLGWVELVQFYLFEYGRPAEQQQQQSAGGNSGIMKGLYTALIRFPFHFLSFLFVVMTFSYFGLVLVWALLGAVINPYKYLPYATGAGTLVFASFYRFSNLQSNREQASKRIHVQITKRLERLLDQRVRAYNKEQDNAQDDAADDTERFLDRRSRSEFFKLVESTGLDRNSVNIQGLANGTNAAVNTIAAQLGVEPTIAMIIVSLARKNADQLLDAAQELGPKLGLDGSLARSLMNLANSWSKESGRQGIKLFIHTVAGVAERNVFFNLSKELESPFIDSTDPAIDLTMGIMPEIAASMLAITEDNDFEPLVEMLNAEKVVRDAFKPVPMQVFSLIQHIFVQDHEGVRSSLIRIIERLLISDSCSLQMTAGGKAIPISKFVEHLSNKLGTGSQLAAVLAKIAVMTPEMSSSTGLQPKGNRQSAGINLSARDKQMIKVLKGAWQPLNRDEIRRPVQSTKRWLRSKIVGSDGNLIVGTDGSMTTDTQNFVLVYQVLCLVDGISAIWMQKPDDLTTCSHFCKEILSLDPIVAGAILALINAEEGGVNPADDTNSTQTMKDRVITPLTKQLSIDVGIKLDPNVTITSARLMEPQISQILSACFALSRGRRVDFTQLAIYAGLPRDTANYIGPLLNGKIKAPLWKQVTPLCNTLGIGDSSIIIALMQLRRQAAMGDYEISTNTLLPWLGVPPRAMSHFRWIIQLAVAQRPAHIQRALVSVFGFKRSAETRKFSMIMARRRRLNVPGESIWYESESKESCDPRDYEAITEELHDSGLDEMNDWIANQIDLPREKMQLLWFLTRHYEGAPTTFDITAVKREFFLFVEEQYPDETIDDAITSKVFDFISFFLTYGEDTPSTKGMALVFKIKLDLLKAVMQLPMYAADMPVRTLRRPRSGQRIEKAVDLLKDYLRVPPEAAYKYNEILSRARIDVEQNDHALFDMCILLDKFKQGFEPRCWEFIQALTLPSDEAYGEFTSRVMYAMLNLERDVEDSRDYLKCAKIDVSSLRSATARNDKWFECRQALRGLLGMCTSNMAQIVAFLHSARWIWPEHSHGLMLKLAVSTVSGNSSHLSEHLRLASGDLTTHRVLYNLTDALTHGMSLNEREREGYSLAYEAICVLSIFRRSGDPQGELKALFGTSLRMVAECLEIHPALITALLSASTGDKATFSVALLQLAQDEGGLSPVVAGGLCSIGSGDVKGVEELADLLDLDPSICEGLVALASGTPTTTRGCLPGLLASLEVDIDLGQGVLGLCNDDSTSIESLATALTVDRPNMEGQVFNTLACLPGLRSANQVRILSALDGLQSSSKLSVRNMSETAMAISLINTNTYAVRDAYGLLKLDLDLACLAATLFKFTTVPFCTFADAYESPAYSWREHMPGNYERDANGSGEQLGAESLFASICSSKLPKLFQRLAMPLGLVADLPESQIRTDNEKSNPQHVSRPWNLRQMGHFLGAVFYSGLTGRFSRLMEALDLPFDRKSSLQDLFEAEGGYSEVIGWFATEEEFDTIFSEADPSTTVASPQGRRKSSNFIATDPRKAIVEHILNAVMATPPQLVNQNPHDKKSNPQAHKTYIELQNYLRKKLSFDARKSLKFILIVYRMGAMNMTPPPVVSRHTSQKRVELILRWASYDPESKVYRIERPSAAKKRKRGFMSNVDWDRSASADTFSHWQAFYLLTAQLTANVLMKYDDKRTCPDFDIVADLRSAGKAAEKCTQALRFRITATSKSSSQDHSKAGGAGDESTNADTPFGALERRQIPVQKLSALQESLEGSASRSVNVLRARARESRIDRIYRILQVADNITGSSIDAFGDDVGGQILGLMWNDQEKTGHYNHMVSAFRLLNLPTNYGPALVAITARDKSHPLLLPRFESSFFPPEAGSWHPLTS